ncbi:hypothetical protein PED39_05560 [Methanomassiliicoccales archaeon LGM-RCC1]|nr:hypothetical protein PED39_05560 [Methanomassiliicoccales archaeon LGM-RCC1]
MSLIKATRDELTFLGEVRKIGSGFFIPFPKKEMDNLGITEENMGFMQMDVTVRIVSRPIEVEDPPAEEDDD